MEEAITAILLGADPVAALVADRVNWGERPGEDMPAITLHRISGARDATMAGRSGLVSSIVQLDVWGRTYRDSKLLARAVIAALPQTRVVAAGITVQGVFINSESDSFEGDDPLPLFRTRIDLSVWHQEN